MSQDILVQKTSEFDRFPGLILGLDGWILRSVPKDLRKQFLAGYEKVLRVVFHPDRYSDPAVKASRQNYLQVVAEAVKFMTTDEFNFEFASDAVPTHTNPFVRLQNAIDIRDRVIDKTNSELESDRRILKSTQAELGVLRRRFNALTDSIVSREKSQALMRRFLSTELQEYPVPIAFSHHKVLGCYFRPIPAEGYGRRFLVDIDTYSSEKYCTEVTPWYKNGEWKSGILTLLEREQVIAFKKSSSGRYGRILGSMPIPYLCECVRNLRSHRPPETTIDDLIKEILTDPSDRHGGIQAFWHEFVKPYLLPFYVPGHLLLMRRKLGCNFFLVRASNASKRPAEAVVWGLENQIRELGKDVVRAREEVMKEVRIVRDQKNTMAERNIQLRTANKRLRHKIEELNLIIRDQKTKLKVKDEIKNSKKETPKPENHENLSVPSI